MKIDKESLKQERDGLRDLINKLEEPYKKKLREIDEILWEEKVKEAEANIGRCFVYRNNCYSCPKRQSDYWDTFYKISDFHKAINDEDYDKYIITQCDKDSLGMIHISQYHDCISAPRFEDYEEVSPKEFDKIYRGLLAELEGK